jgi:hypothetical protein
MPGLAVTKGLAVAAVSGREYEAMAGKATAKKKGKKSPGSARKGPKTALTSKNKKAARKGVQRGAVPTVDPRTVRRVMEHLEELYPDHSTELTFETPFQLLVAVILSAQCTDERVNKTTPALFAAYPDAPAWPPVFLRSTMERFRALWRNSWNWPAWGARRQV